MKSSFILLYCFVSGGLFTFLVSMGVTLLRNRKAGYPFRDYTAAAMFWWASMQLLGMLLRWLGLRQIYSFAICSDIYGMMVVPLVGYIGFSLIKQKNTKVLPLILMEVPYVVLIIAFLLTKQVICDKIAHGLAIAYCIVFLSWVFISIVKFDKALKNSYADVEDRNLRWLQRLLVSMVVFFAAYELIRKAATQYTDLALLLILFVIWWIVYRCISNQRPADVNMISDPAAEASGLFAGSADGLSGSSAAGPAGGSAAGSFGGSAAGSFGGSAAGSADGSVDGSVAGSVDGSVAGSFGGSAAGSFGSSAAGSLTGVPGSSAGFSAGQSVEAKIQTAAFAGELKKLMEEDKFYLNADVTIKTLADMLGTNTTYLSAYINDVIGKNFSAYINDYRLDYASNLLLSDANLTLDDVALRSGFSSMQTFHRLFKQKFGCTPRQYTTAAGK